MNIYCCECKCDVGADLISGKEVYPHRGDLHSLPFWSCPNCNNFVGCHHKTKDRTRPLGVIANQEIKEQRKIIHSILDPMWKSGKYSRGELYKLISERLGFEYHTAKLRDLDTAEKVKEIIKQIR